MTQKFKVVRTHRPGASHDGISLRDGQIVELNADTLTRPVFDEKRAFFDRNMTENEKAAERAEFVKKNANIYLAPAPNFAGFGPGAVATLEVIE